MVTRLSLRAHGGAIATRAVNWLSRLSGRGEGTVAGGRVGLAICPTLLQQLARGREIVLVSGTNGKTTTTAMVAAGWGGEVATNATGANMPAGHVAALVNSRSLRAVLEVDEAWLGQVVEAVQPAVVILLNLSRDQLDRANEVRQLAQRWRAVFSLRGQRDVTVIANANDPLVVFATANAAVQWCDVPTPWLSDATSCPNCTKPLARDSSSYGCSCGFTKPTTATTILRDELTVGGREVKLDLSLPGLFNRANAAMALSALDVLHVDLGNAAQRISTLERIAGRFETRRWKEHRIRLFLAKNPAGFTAALSTIGNTGSDVWVAINARGADGRDPSWLYDVPFELLKGHRVWCWGDRRLDLAARLDYGGVDVRVVDDERDVPVSSGVVTLLANYTAFSDFLAKSQSC